MITVPATIFCAPLLAGIAIWVKIDSPGPVFFRQKRVGIHQKYFEILKFRTMRADTPKDVPTHLLENPDQYITKSGKFLRATSLDELPQLMNILKGDSEIIFESLSKNRQLCRVFLFVLCKPRFCSKKPFVNKFLKIS